MDATKAAAAGHAHDDRATRRTPELTHAAWSWRSVRTSVVAGIALTVALLIVGQVTTTDLVGELDRRLLDTVVDVRPSWAVSAARLASALGDYGVIAIVAVTAVVVGRSRARAWNVGWLVTASLGGSFVIAGVLKVLTDRMRPAGALVETTSASFPSGHTVRAVVLYGLLAWLLAAAGSRRGRVLAIAAVSAGLLSAASRVVLGAHWPTDVAAGVALGVVWLAVIVRVTSPRPKAEPHLAGGSSRTTSSPGRTGSSCAPGSSRRPRSRSPCGPPGRGEVDGPPRVCRTFDMREPGIRRDPWSG